MTAFPSSSSPQPTTQGVARIDQRFHNLVEQSLATLEDLLQDESLTALERGKLALDVLALARQSPEAPELSHLNSLGRPFRGTPELNRPSEPSYLDEVVCFDDFLSPEENQNALAIALDQQEKFVPSSTTSKADNYRQSCILYATHFPQFYHQLKHKILVALPEIWHSLKHSPFPVTQVEMQLTVHGDGCYYKVHNDSGSPETITRELTYVYYVHSEPAQFSGGELRLYQTDPHDGRLLDRQRFKTVTPQNNRLVLFNSRCQHEVMPVRCSSQTFEASRFTFNGWLRR
ncbi:hydroxylase [Geitlerinema sp. P-1104]|uniref:2OG-Fe(II) oxygenase n=1 Tax=Geitlerinema sp. P-1104 TaxID=2546230 RepID=UPI00147727D6|nr:2OG-Fe(II) oxygenase [Geitlerinema sp. P-1104]NMG60782.1 hydroxylase [Geitlerinema sp. P-1104]